jgi:hypothetical protein
VAKPAGRNFGSSVARRTRESRGTAKERNQQQAATCGGGGGWGSGSGQAGQYRDTLASTDGFCDDPRLSAVYGHETSDGTAGLASMGGAVSTWGGAAETTQQQTHIVGSRLVCRQPEVPMLDIGKELASSRILPALQEEAAYPGRRNKRAAQLRRGGQAKAKAGGGGAQQHVTTSTSTSTNAADDCEYPYADYHYPARKTLEEAKIEGAMVAYLEDSLAAARTPAERTKLRSAASCWFHDEDAHELLQKYDLCTNADTGGGAAAEGRGSGGSGGNGGDSSMTLTRSFSMSSATAGVGAGTGTRAATSTRCRSASGASGCGVAPTGGLGASARRGGSLSSFGSSVSSASAASPSPTASRSPTGSSRPTPRKLKQSNWCVVMESEQR